MWGQTPVQRSVVTIQYRQSAMDPQSPLVSTPIRLLLLLVSIYSLCCSLIIVRYRWDPLLSHIIDIFRRFLSKIISPAPVYTRFYARLMGDVHSTRFRIFHDGTSGGPQSVQASTLYQIGCFQEYIDLPHTSLTQQTQPQTLSTIRIFFLIISSSSTAQATHRVQNPWESSPRRWGNCPREGEFFTGCGGFWE